MINNFVSLNSDDDAEEPEELNDEEATLADDLLDEVAGGEVEEDDALEGFGILPIKEEEEEEEKEEDEEGDESLEEDAEDVEFDTFDDVDEL